MQTAREAQRRGAPRSLALCHYYLGATDYFHGRFQDALNNLTEAVGLYRRLDAPAGEAVGLQFLGMTETALGRLVDARAHLEQGIAAAQRSTIPSHTLVRLYAALARHYLDAQDLPAASRAAEQGLSLVDANRRCICNASIACVAAAALAMTGAVDRAAELGQQALDRATELGSPFFLCMANQANATAFAISGEWGAAFRSLDEARGQAAANGFAYELGRIILMRAFVHLQRRTVRDLPAASALLATALPIFLRLGARVSAAQARSSLRFLRNQAERSRQAGDQRVGSGRLAPARQRGAKTMVHRDG